MPDESLRAILTLFGKVLAIKEEMWSRAFRYTVANGIRQVTMVLTQHITSHLIIAGHRMLLSYEGQPSTCYGCGDIGRMYQACPKRQRRGTWASTEQTSTYVTIAAPSTPQPVEPLEGTAKGASHTDEVSHKHT